MKDVCNEPLMVTVRCLTYNQEGFIRQCLEGFVMQRTNFRFEATVHDDASTDGTAAIIREYAEKYPDIIKPLYETENQYSKHDGSLSRIMDAHTHGKYIALCEGDDYWTDPLKLQKQVDFMEAHPECSLTYHACKNVFEDGCTDVRAFGEEVSETCSLKKLMKYPFQTSSVLFRKEVLIDNALYKKAIATGCLSGDEILFLTAYRMGTIRGVNEQMSVYRRHPQGVSQKMHDADKMWDNFNGWLRLVKVYGGDIGRQIQKRRLRKYIYQAYTCKDYALFRKMLRACAAKAPMTILHTIPYMLRHPMRRFAKMLARPFTSKQQ